MKLKNQIKMCLQSLSENVAIARVTAAAFAAQLDLTISEIDEIKVAISEAVSNAVIHGYNTQEGMIDMTMNLYDNQLEFIIQDYGRGIEDVALARQPSFSTDPERMGLGFVFMESFMDELDIQSKPQQGTIVRMAKFIEPHTTH